jgi:hypothetical protein
MIPCTWIETMTGASEQTLEDMGRVYHVLMSIRDVVLAQPGTKRQSALEKMFGAKGYAELRDNFGTIESDLGLAMSRASATAKTMNELLGHILAAVRDEFADRSSDLANATAEHVMSSGEFGIEIILKRTKRMRTNLSCGCTRVINIRRRSDQKIIHTLDVSGRAERSIASIMEGVLAQMNNAEYYAEDTGADIPSTQKEGGDRT